MKWLKVFFNWLKILTGKIVGKFNLGNNNKPRSKAVIDIDPVTNKAIGDPYFIIINGKGQTLEAPYFTTQEEADAWIENYLIDLNSNPKNN